MDNDFPWITPEIKWSLQFFIFFFKLFIAPASHLYPLLPVSELACYQAWETEQTFTEYYKTTSAGHSIILLKMWEWTAIAKGKCRMNMPIGRMKLSHPISLTVSVNWAESFGQLV